MSVIRFNNSFDRMADPALREKATYIAKQLLVNANIFSAPDPDLAKVQADIEAFSKAISAAKTGDRLKIAIREQKKEALVDTLHLLSAWCAYVCKGNLLTAALSGFTLAKSRTALPPIGKPENLKVQNTNQSGEMRLSLNTVAGAVAYVYQYTTDAALNEESWITVNASQSKCTLMGLQPGTTYYFRVVAIGRKSQVMYSDVMSRIAV